MAECCGKQCDTPFCPTCGKKLWQPEALALLAHLESRASQLEIIAQSRASRQEQKDWSPRDIIKHRGWVQKSAKSAEKWRAWADLVSGWIARDRESGK